MSNTKKKRTGLGAASYFDDVPSLNEPTPDTSQTESKSDSTKIKQPVKSQRGKIRRTYALSAETQLALETMKLEARKQGENVTLGDLMEEAVRMLVEKRGVKV